VNGHPLNGSAIKFYPVASTGLDWKPISQAISNFRLYPNYPNPFNPETTIAFDLVKSGPVELKIYNVVGEEVKTLINNSLLPGSYKIIWDGTDNSDQQVASGIYIYSLKTGNSVQSNKMVLLK
jgi:hypothetical protein